MSSGRSRVKILFVITLIIVIIILFFAMFFVSFPLRWEAEVCRSCKEFGTDAPLVFAVIREESGFKAESISPKGAVGLMQLTPSTAEYVASELLKEPAGDISDADTNIRYGTWYLAELEDEFNGNDVLALAAYNAGRGNVHDWIEKNHWRDNFSDVDKIPYAETRDYVKRVLHCREKYAELYGKNKSIPTPIALHELRFARLKNLSL